MHNDEPLHRQKVYIFRALARKKDRNVYRGDLAPKAFVPLLNAAAKKYVREFGSPSDQWHLVFSPIERRHAALALVEQFQTWYQYDYPAIKAKGRF